MKNGSKVENRMRARASLRGSLRNLYPKPTFLNSHDLKPKILTTGVDSDWCAYYEHSSDTHSREVRSLKHFGHPQWFFESD